MILLSAVIIFIVPLAPPAMAQFQWSQRVASAASLPEGEPNTGLALDTNANCYVTGWFDSTNNFGGSTLTNQSIGGSDIFVAKYNASGALQWAQQAGQSAGKLLTDCNLHTIVRLPQSTFHPATVSTNLLFFEKGTPTKEIWYYEHQLPEGQKSYSKTKIIQFDEFTPMIKWWSKRKETEVAWRVKVGNLKKGFDLDVKNPNSAVEEHDLTVPECLDKFRKSMERVSQALEAVEREYASYSN